MFRNCWLPALLVWCVVILVATLFPANHLSHISDFNLYPGADLLAHFVLFLLFGILGTGTLIYRYNIREKNLILLYVLVSGIIFAGITELLQLLLPVNRDASFDDLLADFAGVISGSLLVLALNVKK